MAVALVLIVSVALTGCSTNKPAEQPKEMKTSWNVGAEPETLDPALSTGIPESTVQLALFEGLTRLGAGDKVEPGVAESWKVSDDGLTYTFKLRDSKWSNGDAITADDFKYSWLRALDPKLAAEYAYQLYYIKGAEAYNGGKGKVEDVAIKVVDPKTLEVTLEAPTTYFLSLVSFHTYYPVNKKVVDGNKDWALKTETIVGNGPFKIKDWKHQDQIVVVKNDQYWDNKNVKLTELTYKLLEDNKASLTAFESGQIDGTDNVPVEDLDRLRQAKQLHTDPYIGTYYYRFNVTKKPFNDPKVRKALTMAINRQTLIDKVVKGGQTPALAFTPFGLPDSAAGSDFRKVGKDFIKEDLTEAKKLLADAGYPDGKGWPADVTILYNTSSNHKVIAEAIQNMWKTNLGIDVKLRNEEWKVYLESQKKLNYNVSRAGWIGDYLDAMTFMDMFVTGGGNNQTGWSNKDYDKAIADAKKATKPEDHVKGMHDAEKVLMDEMPVMPIYYYVNNYVLKDYVKDVFRSALGPIDFKKASVDKK